MRYFSRWARGPCAVQSAASQGEGPYAALNKIDNKNQFDALLQPDGDGAAKRSRMFQRDGAAYAFTGLRYLRHP
jgi:hypothetical protein